MKLNPNRVLRYAGLAMVLLGIANIAVGIMLITRG